MYDDMNYYEDSQSSAARRQKLFKTQMCRHVLATGSCAHGDYCHFAHSDDELRPVVSQESLNGYPTNGHDDNDNQHYPVSPFFEREQHREEEERRLLVVMF